MEPYNFQKHVRFIHKFEESESLTAEENKTLSRTGIIIINVPQSIERREKITAWVKDLNMHTYVFDAVSGLDITVHETDANPLVNIIRYNNSYFLLDYTRHFDHFYRGDISKGMIAASLSHLLIYSLLQFQTSFDQFLVLEDDASLLEQDISVVRKYLANVPHPFDLAYLNSESKWYPLELTTPINDHYSHVKRNFFNASVSYLVSKEGAAKLLAYSRHDVTRPPDDLLSNPHVLSLYTVIASNVFLFSCDYSFVSDTERFSKT
jgi:GR25 family glycosyltransferase involved in LPS biosynthesis